MKTGIQSPNADSIGSGIVQKLRMLVPFLLVLFVIVVRNWTAVFKAGFWAEDGPCFFRDALALNYMSVFKPVWGYNFLLSRLIAYSATFFPIFYTPYFYAWGCLFFNVVAIGYFSRDGFSWLIQKKSHRVFTCLLLAVAPGGTEVFLNLCNLHSSLMLWVILLLIERPIQLSWSRLLGLLFLSLSAGQFIVLLPVICLLAYLSRDIKYVYLGLFNIGVALVNAVGSHAFTRDLPDVLNYGNFIFIPGLLLENFLNRFVFGPFLGANYVDLWMHGDALIYWPVSVMVCALLIYFIRTQKIDRFVWMIILTVMMSVIGSFGIVAIVRAYNVDLIGRFGKFQWEHRYSYLPGSIAIIAWMALILSDARAFLSRNLLEKAAIPILLGLVVFNHLSRWDQINERPSTSWPEKAEELQRILDQRSSGKLTGPVLISNVPGHPLENPSFKFISVIVYP